VGAERATVAETPALDLRDVAVAYDGITAIEGVTGTVAPGELLALIGPNGSGKSTLLEAILGLVPLRSGSILVHGEAPASARRDIAYVPQQDALDAEFPVSVIDVVTMGRYRRVGWVRRPGRADRAIAAGALERVGLSARAGDRFGTLSGGQRQRVLLARAIAQRAPLLLLDEPFNGVDGTTQALLLDVLAELQSEGAAVVMSTHDLSIAQVASNQACVLSTRQVAFGPAEQALTVDNLRQAYGANALVLVADSHLHHPRQLPT
jgi:manganese/iron transport system ATP-binding protein